MFARVAIDCRIPYSATQRRTSLQSRGGECLRSTSFAGCDDARASLFFERSRASSCLVLRRAVHVVFFSFVFFYLHGDVGEAFARRDDDVPASRGTSHLMRVEVSAAEQHQALVETSRSLWFEMEPKRGTREMCGGDDNYASSGSAPCGGSGCCARTGRRVRPRRELRARR